MMLKKQTVWLLTMLSLVVVLSVYYVTSPEGGASDIVMTGENKDVKETDNQKADTAKEEPVAEESKDEVESKEEVAKEEPKAEATEGSEKETAVEDAKTEEFEDGGTITSSVTSEELFAELRMELDDSRSEQKEKLKSTIASSEVSAEEKSVAKDEMEALDEAAKKEHILETLIKSKGYEDALVRAEGNNVKITVKASKEHDKSSANEILLLVKDEIKNMNDVVVTFK
ncbi:SpoIIIAH-like family protein [Metabacillus malikii]|uniref:Stage III sporulation protein AH n=1 Tax=Metabacillus malikii TaxID=1504265 RepID=A0ABT9ZI16_9BACI|nr:SpoIIIAH-like family protein [Metabacillus malikii]MDQ0231926.1 stage III sporulation protein AH [Metabacillus malikii]